MHDVCVVTHAKVSRVDGLALRNITKVFGQTRALTAVDIDIEYGRVLGLLGHNGSGKSTLFKILAGVYEPDAGSLSVDGRDIPLPLTGVGAAEIGLTFVHQDPVMLPELSVAENLFLERMSAAKRRPVSWSKLRTAARKTMHEFGLNIDVDVAVAKLGSGQRAQLAIARAAGQARERSRDGKAFLMLDEPTVFLSQAERSSLFTLIRSLADSGVGVVLVSHDLSDIKAVTDRVCVLRDGRVSALRTTTDTDKRQLVSDIVGDHRDVTAAARAGRTEGQAERNRVVTVRKMTGHGLREIDLTLHRGEIVGLTGLVGAGYSNILYLLYGAKRSTSGQLNFDGDEYALRTATPQKSISGGMVFVPGHRLKEGLIGTLPACENLAMPILGRFQRRGHVNAAAIAKNFDVATEHFSIRPPIATQPAGEFSGGNQQKILMAKWLQTDPKVVLVDEPTQGVDVGARQEILGRLRQLADSGQSGVVVASSDYEQLAEICDRVLIVAHGSVVGELAGGDVSAGLISAACLRGSVDDTDGDVVTLPVQSRTSSIEEAQHVS